MNAADVGRTFMHVQQRLSGTPCHECRSRNTDAYVYELAVIVSCRDCGGATRKGRMVAPRGTA
ncbi:hypothetical protein [Streptomyces tritici]|uniref:hypothetical protein n=1 Tax=Streptomyces tritici TaxID=2054410 RepID=UPI003AEFE00B